MPASEVRFLDVLFDDPQVEANGLVQAVVQPGIGDVRLLGNVFKVDGLAAPAHRGAPRLGEHVGEVFGMPPQPSTPVSEAAS